MVFKESVAAQHVRVANRQLRQAEDYIVESADFVAVALAGSTDRAPTAPDRRIYKCWLTTWWVPAQQEISDVRAPRVEVCKTQGWDFVTLPEGLERGLQHGTARLTRQYAPIASIAHKATGALQRLCLSTLNVLRGKARPRPRNPVNPHRQEQSASPYVRQLA